MVLNEKQLEMVDQYIANNRNEIIKSLRELVEIPSVRGDATPEAPYGTESLKALIKSLELCKESGYYVRIAKSKKYGVAESRLGVKNIGIFAHCDVVAADGEWLYGEPFKLTESGGFLIGRGCNDDKSGIIQMLYAAKIIDALKLPMKHGLILFIGANEEDGMDDIADFVSNEKMPDASIVVDGEYPYYVSEKSRLILMLESAKEFDNIINLSGGKCYNVILDRLNIEYSDGSKTIEHGRSGHAGYPKNSESALTSFARNADTNEKLSETDKQILREIFAFLSDYKGLGLGIAYTDDYFGELTVANGIVRTADKKLQISLDIRHAGTISGEQLLEKIQKKVGSSWKIIEHSISNGYKIDETSTIATALREAYGELSETGTIIGKKASGGTYSKYLKNSFSIGTVMPHSELKHNFAEG
ncbi:MAG: M20/M25/M40 family metallo-hydrolase, partial [Clostridia bacterium]|nr:M20/M25/M40 family metallo-hydrolase [Clostridia bacterium]